MMIQYNIAKRKMGMVWTQPEKSTKKHHQMSIRLELPRKEGKEEGHKQDGEEARPVLVCVDENCPETSEMVKQPYVPAEKKRNN